MLLWKRLLPRTHVCYLHPQLPPPPPLRLRCPLLCLSSQGQRRDAVSTPCNTLRDQRRWCTVHLALQPCSYSLLRWRDMNKAYDIIVIGSGAAGCAAARACALQNPAASIALIEQGSRAAVPQAMRVPLMQPYIASMRKARPFLQTLACVAEENLAGRSLPYTLGRGLGGSCLCNDMKYMRGTRKDYEAWADASWTYDTLLPVFKSLEANSRGGSRDHGEDGLLLVTDAQRSNIDSGMNVRFFEACEAAGVPVTNDFNTGEADGFSAMQSYIDEGVRVQPFDALITSMQHHTPNLDLLDETCAERIHCTAGKVRSVEVSHLRDKKVLEARHVVVCAGTLRTPLLLQRSGIGAKGTVLDAPAVGQNLITTSTADLVFRIRNPSNVYSKSISWRNSSYLYRQWCEYSENRTGVFSSFVEGAAYVRSQKGQDAPDLSILFFRTPQMGMADWPRSWPMDGFTMRVTHHYPSSRGEVLYDNSTGTTLIRNKMLSTKEDVLAMDEGVKWVGLLTTCDGALRSVYHVDEKGRHVSPFWSYGAALHHPRGGLTTQLSTAAFLAENVKSGGDLYGTCAMGTVVDSQLRVNGVDGLFVADSSVVPVPTVASSSTLGSVIGTRVASFIH
ncbi:oxidoreductase, putative [Leishmania tarentolae]|uniref:Oxidoreductase, putative n=1 Tax=Leishmania tarentolae TaxID=5689 RepID=A0A640KW80_LEITA|nr:oxidoreductase, putative [Leishmania tarentolae]